jgi:hypothetical protein
MQGRVMLAAPECATLVRGQTIMAPAARATDSQQRRRRFSQATMLEPVRIYCKR